ncbi:MAG: hypothetical protein RLN67_14065, partial [Algiphilus sp.]
MNKAQAREQASGEPLDGHLPQPELGLPLVITASAPNTALASWLEAHRKEVMAARRQHGALCFRGFA